MWLGSSELEATSASIGVNSSALLWLTTVTSRLGTRGRSRSSWRAVPTPPKPPPRMTTRTGVTGERPPGLVPVTPARCLVAASWNSSPAIELSSRAPRRLGSRSPTPAVDQATCPPISSGQNVSGTTTHQASPRSRPPVSALAWLWGRCRNTSPRIRARPAVAWPPRPRASPGPIGLAAAPRRAGDAACRPGRLSGPPRVARAGAGSGAGRRPFRATLEENCSRAAGSLPSVHWTGTGLGPVAARRSGEGPAPLVARPPRAGRAPSQDAGGTGQPPVADARPRPERPSAGLGGGNGGCSAVRRRSGWVDRDGGRRGGCQPGSGSWPLAAGPSPPRPGTAIGRGGRQERAGGFLRQYYGRIRSPRRPQGWPNRLLSFRKHNYSSAARRNVLEIDRGTAPPDRGAPGGSTPSPAHRAAGVPGGHGRPAADQGHQEEAAPGGHQADQEGDPRLHTGLGQAPASGAGGQGELAPDRARRELHGVDVHVERARALAELPGQGRVDGDAAGGRVPGKGRRGLEERHHDRAGEPSGTSMDVRGDRLDAAPALLEADAVALDADGHLAGGAGSAWTRHLGVTGHRGRERRPAVLGGAARRAGVGAAPAGAALALPARRVGGSGPHDGGVLPRLRGGARLPDRGLRGGGTTRACGVLDVGAVVVAGRDKGGDHHDR